VTSSPMISYSDKMLMRIIAKNPNEAKEAALILARRLLKKVSEEQVSKVVPELRKLCMDPTFSSSAAKKYLQRFVTEAT
jgi:hypothetical protein